MSGTRTYPVWATQGGGLVRDKHDSGVYIFVEKPEDVPGLDVGDVMPVEWGIIPANDLARDEIDREEFSDLDSD